MKSELWSDCPDFHLGWQFIVLLCSCFFPLSVQSSTCSTLGPASLHVPVLSFCTDLVGELWSFCTESEYLHQSIISGVLRAISTVSVLSCHWLDVHWLLYVFISSKLHQLSKEVWVGQVPRAPFFFLFAVFQVVLVCKMYFWISWSFNIQFISGFRKLKVIVDWPLLIEARQRKIWSINDQKSRHQGKWYL